MWEMISRVLTDDGAAIVLCFLMTVIIVAILTASKGIVSVQTKNFSFGGSTCEREIIRRQVEMAHDYIMAAIIKQNFSDNYHSLYIFECVYDKIVEWIIFNHINTLPIYVQAKQDAVWNLVQSLNPPKEFKTAMFEKRVREWVREIIGRLIEIRKLYEDIKK